MNRITVVPAKGRAVPDPETGELLLAEGREVPDDAYWRRRVNDDDVKIKDEGAISGEPPAPAEQDLGVEPDAATGPVVPEASTKKPSAKEVATK
jgi:hypothetical protein